MLLAGLLCPGNLPRFQSRLQMNTLVLEGAVKQLALFDSASSYLTFSAA